MKLPEKIQELINSPVLEDVIIGVHLIDKLPKIKLYFEAGENKYYKKLDINCKIDHRPTIIIGRRHTYWIDDEVLAIWKPRSKCTWAEGRNTIKIEYE